MPFIPKRCKFAAQQRRLASSSNDDVTQRPSEAPSLTQLSATRTSLSHTTAPWQSMPNHRALHYALFVFYRKTPHRSNTISLAHLHLYPRYHSPLPCQLSATPSFATRPCFPARSSVDHDHQIHFFRDTAIPPVRSNKLTEPLAPQFPLSCPLPLPIPIYTHTKKSPHQPSPSRSLHKKPRPPCTQVTKIAPAPQRSQHPMRTKVRPTSIPSFHALGR